MLYWDHSRPNDEGWYFWKRSRAVHDPIKWRPIFITAEDTLEDGHTITCWEDGTAMPTPRGGWWLTINE